MTQLDLQNVTGVAASETSNIENGKVDPRLGTLIRLAEGLDARLADLIDGVT
jgi:transcriptional regulator with XRE-family HTH domain